MNLKTDSSGVGRRIRHDIETKIRSGEWPPGFRIPVEHELTQTYLCSRATVSKAIGQLVSSGLIERRKRAGSFVAQPPVHAALLEIPDIATVLAARGEYAFHPLSGRHLAQRLRQALPEASTVGPPCRLVEGLHLSAGRPFAHELRSISLVEVPDAAAVDFAHVAPGSWLLEQVAWSDARHRVAAVNPAGGVAAALQIERSTACLEVSRVTWRNGRAITAVVQTFPGERYDLIGSFRPAEGQ